MELDVPQTVGAFVIVIAVAVGSLFVLPELTPMTPMGTDTILMMVVPSTVLFGAIMLAIGVAHGQFRASQY